jgi:hypothetical protein
MQMYLHKVLVIRKKLLFCWHLVSHGQKKQDPDRWYGSPDPDSYQNITDSQHC